MSGKKGPPVEEKGEQAPLWIISFADMISLLMAFFVMLLTMAHSKTGNICADGAGVFEKTMEGFRSSISAYGVPNWVGLERDNMNFNSQKSHYNINSKVKPPEPVRVIDSHEDKIREIYKKLSDDAKTLKSQIQGSKPEFTVLPITFQQGQAVLSPTSQEILNKFIQDLSAASSTIKTIYVVGLAPEETSDTRQWTVSAMRAKSVSDYIKNKLQSRFAVYSWGAGPGGAWVSKEGVISKESQISIAILKTGE